jgi:glycosyltransferase involved in cell wall biosynthesis
METVNRMEHVQILLTTYNSADYIRAQLDSVFSQSHADFDLLIRDGGSADSTVEELRKYQRRYPDRIRLLLPGSRATAAENFGALLEESTGELVMFADHDDVWLPDKIRDSLQKYREAEARYGSGTPILVFTDSRVVGEDLRPVADSVLRYQHLDAAHLSLNQLILQNVPPSNTMLLNRALVDLARPVPPEAVMHDHWISLTASALGHIVYLDSPTLLYRQHDDNIYGAFHYSSGALLGKLCRGPRKLRERFEQNIRQAAAFGKRFGAALPPRDREMLERLAEWDRLGFWARRKVLWKYRIFKCGLLRNLGVFFIA